MTTFRGRLSLSDPARYRICVQGRIDPVWAKSSTQMAISVDDPQDPQSLTTLEGEVLDQAELVGLINQLYGLGLSLLLVQALPNASALSADTPPTG